MSSLLVGILGALMSTNQPAALSNVVEQATGLSVPIAGANDPVREEFRALMRMDDAAGDEVDRWILENNLKRENAMPSSEMNERIRRRLEPVRQAYEDFIARHPGHAEVRVAFASFLGDLGEDYAQIMQLTKAAELNPRDPATWNNLGNYYGHNGPTEKAFECYDKAIALNPDESVYYHNFGTTVYLFRKAATEYYNLTEQQVFDKAFELYRRAREISPNDFALATDVAQTYYGIKPARTDDALRAWTNALDIAQDAIQREGVYLHMARFKLNAGRFDEARAHLAAVTNGMYLEVKERVARTLERKEAEASGTNSPPTGETDLAE